MQIKSQRLNYKSSLKKLPYFLLLLFFNSVSNFAFSQNDVYDLALITGISTDYATEYCPGDEVRFNNVIYNIGNVEACDVEITAYIPSGTSVSSNPLNSVWTINGSVATTTITSCIPPGGVYPNAESGSLSAFLELELNNAPASVINFYAEISRDDGNDIDSTPDNNPNNDAGAVPNSATDGVIWGEMGDEDDHDVSSITILECERSGCTDPCAPNYDSSAETDDGSCAAYSTVCNADICAGDVTVWNTATCGCAVSVTQVLGCTDATASNYNPAANCDNGSCTAPPAPPVGDYDLALITGISSSYGTTYCPGDEVRFNTVIYNTGEVEACNVEITAYIPAGMSVSNNPLNSIWTINGSTATANINSCIPPGGTYPNADTDPLSAFLILEITGSPGSMVNFYAEISMDDGDDIDSTPDNNPNNDAGAVPNTATDNSIYNPADEDDHDVASITICEEEGIYDLALITGISSSYGTTYCPGDEVRFNTVIYNTGEVEACNVEITAYIPAGMSVSNNPLNSIWTINGSTATANINSCIPPGGTYPNASTDPLSAFLILEISGSPGSMVNFYAEISMDDGDDIDSTPDNNPNNDAGAVPNTATDNSIYHSGDEDDHDVASITICEEEGIYDLALITGISSSYGTTYCPDEVGFSITVYNQGEEQACNVQVAATIPPGMSFNSSNPLNSIWTVNGNIATTTINTCIAPGGTASLNIYLLLDTDATATTINFFAEISMDDGNDIDSTTDNDLYNDPGAIANTGTDNTINGEMGDEDDHDVAAITVGTLLNYDLALINGISSSFGAVYCPGDEVRYNSVIYNTGDVTACNVQITAYIPEGMSVSSNPLNSIWTINGSVATTNITSCIPPGGVYPNENSDPLSTFLILELDGAPATEINFYSEISMDDGNDVDSTADSDPNNDPGAVPNSNTDNTIQNQGGDEDDHDVASITIGDDCGGVIFKVQSHNNFVINKKLIENKQLIEMIYPTISDNSVNVKLASSATGKALIQVVDVNGAVVYNENWELNQALTNNVKIDIDFLSKGLYLIYVTKGDEIGSGKFLKE